MATGATKVLMWLDLETTGLDENKNQILEIGVCFTDADNGLFPLKTGLGPLTDTGGVISALIVPDPNEELTPFIMDMHGKSGLLDELINTRSTAIGHVEQAICSLMESYSTDRWEIMIAGNSVHMDVRFLAKHMPKILERCHYRILDMSAVAAFYETLGVSRPDNGKGEHRVVSDIQWSRRLFGVYADHALRGVER